MEYGVDVLIALLAAHVLGDFLLQTRRDVVRKRRPAVMARHVLVHGVLAYLISGLWLTLWLPVVIAATHFAIDWFKLKFGEGSLRWFVGDQVAHLAVLIVVAATAGSISGPTVWHMLQPDLIFPAMAIFAGFVLTVRVGSMTVGLALAPYLIEMQDRAGERVMPWKRGFEDGGRVIGYLERTLLFVFVVAGHMTAVGFLVAAKAFLRIGEIKDAENRLEAEYIIIGTLASFAHGIITAYGTALLLGMR